MVLGKEGSGKGEGGGGRLTEDGGHGDGEIFEGAGGLSDDDGDLDGETEACSCDDLVPYEFGGRGANVEGVD